MKLRCKKDHEDATNGFLGIGAKDRTKIEGLTVGNTYTGELVPIVASYQQGTRIHSGNIMVMIYDDHGYWVCRDINLFEPI